MGRNYEVIDAFLTSYVKNDWQGLSSALAEDIQIQYSTVGNHTGLGDVRDALKWKESYNVHTVTTTNVLSYIEGEHTVVGLIAHHLIGNEAGSEFYPLCFGGKYVFTLDNSTGKISRICYAQEYQVENTLYIRDWKLAGNNPDLSAVAGFYLLKARDAAAAGSNPQEAVKELSKVFFWAMDTNNLAFAKELVTSNIHALRYKTMSYGKIETSGADELEQFIKDCRAYYAMDQYSIAIRSVDERDGALVVNASHLVPHRTGTKKLNVNTKYHSFFDEDIQITFIAEGGAWRIQDLSMKKIVDVHYNGFDILHF